jgi:hypothetical protein
MWVNTQYPAPHLESLNNYALRMQNKLVGWDFIYLKRDKIAIDRILTEVDKSIVKDTFPFKAVIDLSRSFDTGGAMLSKFGLSNDVELIFSISQEDFDKFKNEKNDPDLESLIRPTEGDLIYFPYNNNMWEITFCDNRPMPGFKYNPTLVWEVSCQLYEETNDSILTGDVDLDKFDSDNTGSIFGMVFEVSPYSPDMIPKKSQIIHQRVLDENGQEQVVWTAEVSGYNVNNNQLTVKNPIGQFDSMNVLYSDDGSQMYSILEVKEVIQMASPVIEGSQNNQFDALDGKILEAANKIQQSFKQEVKSPTGTKTVVPQEVIDNQNSILTANQQQILETNKQKIAPVLFEDSDFDTTDPFGGN